MKRLPLLAALLVILALCGALAAACGGSATEPAAEPAATTATTAVTPDAIPVEALPDPLPDPYLFRDTAAVVEEEQREVIYIVQPGDTLAGIAAGYCVTIEEIQRLNNIVDAASLSIGDELRIPGTCDAPAAPTAGASDDGQAAESAPQRPPGEIYVVEPGDTLAGIADAFGFGWRDIAAYNNLSDFDAGNLQVGQELVIPPPSASAEESQQATQERAEPPG